MTAVSLSKVLADYLDAKNVGAQPRRTYLDYTPQTPPDITELLIYPIGLQSDDDTDRSDEGEAFQVDVVVRRKADLKNGQITVESVDALIEFAEELRTTLFEDSAGQQPYGFVVTQTALPALVDYEDLRVNHAATAILELFIKPV